MAAAETALELAPGTAAVLKLLTGAEVTGVVFGLDRENQVIILRNGDGFPENSTLIAVNAGQIADVVSASPPAQPPAAPSLPSVDPTRTAMRERRAVKLARQEAAKIGVGVSRRAQAVFDAIAKTLPAEWSGKKIVVLDEVVIDEPYTVESSSSLTDNNPTILERVRLIMEREPQLASVS